MITFEQMNALNDEFEIGRDEHPIESEAIILAEGTVSSKILSALKEEAGTKKLPYSMQRGKGGTEHYTLGGETATLKARISPENKATLILKESEMRLSWWKEITDATLKPSDVIIESN